MSSPSPDLRRSGPSREFNQILFTAPNGEFTADNDRDSACLDAGTPPVSVPTGQRMLLKHPELSSRSYACRGTARREFVGTGLASPVRKFVERQG